MNLDRSDTIPESTAALPLNIDEYERAARSLLSPMVYDYIAGGAADEVTLRGNRAAFDRWRLLPRVLRGVDRADLQTTVLGHDTGLPILIAPTGFHRLVHDEGELATARAAHRADTIYTLSTASTYAIEEVAAHAGAWWFQLYIYVDRAITRDLVQRAEASGAHALVVTVDTTVLGRREADERNRFTLPEGVTFANFTDVTHRHLPSLESGSGLAKYTTSGMTFDPTIHWRDLDWLASITSLPILPKGILAADDARIAMDHGAGGVIVSNHGGRQLDTAVATLDALSAIVDAVGQQGEVLLDGGVRRGTDVLKALALGARAVMIGRPVLWGLASGGEAGVSHLFDLLRNELATAMVLCGAATIADITRSLVVPAGVVPNTVGHHRA